MNFGNILSTGLDVLLNRPGSGPSALPKKAILSSNVTLSLMSPDGELIPIGEFEDMSKTKVYDEKKKFKPFGSMKTIVLQKDVGWELSLSGQKVDGLIDRLIYIQEKLLNGNGLSSMPNSENTFNSISIISNKPLFSLKEITMDSKKNYHTYHYEDVSIVGYSEDIPSDSNPITYTLNLFSPYRNYISSGADSDGDSMESTIMDIITDLVNRNKQ